MASLSAYQQKMVTVVYKTQCPPPSELAQTVRQFSSADARTVTKQLVLVALPRLALYPTVDLALAGNFLQLLSQQDRSVTRLVVYFLKRILACDGRAYSQWEEMATKVVPIMTKELATTGHKPGTLEHVRQVALLGALALRRVPDPVKEPTKRLLLALLDSIAKQEEEAKTQRKSKTKLEQRAVARGALQRAALGALRSPAFMTSEVEALSRAVIGLGCVDGVGARHAAAILSKAAAQKPVALAAGEFKLFRRAMSVAAASKDPKANFITGGGIVLNLSDPLMKVYLARACGNIVNSPELKGSEETLQSVMQPFRALLQRLVYDGSVSVVFASASALAGVGAATSSKNIKETDDGRVRARAWAHLCAEGGSILQTVSQRVGHVLIQRGQKIPHQPSVHGACRVVEQLFRARTYSHQRRPSTIDSEPETASVVNKSMAFAMLPQHLRTGMKTENIYIRCSALKALLWYFSGKEDSRPFASTLKAELRDPNWSRELLDDLLSALLQRLIATPQQVPKLMPICAHIASTVLSKVRIETLNAVWKGVLREGSAESCRAVMQCVFDCIDVPPPIGPPRDATQAVKAASSKRAEAWLRLQSAAYWFLGENGNVACSEYAWQFNPMRVDLPEIGLDSNTRSRTLNAIAKSNPLMLETIERLSTGSLTKPWEVRVTAARSLGKLAIRSPEPYRFQCYSSLCVLIPASRGPSDGRAGLGTTTEAKIWLRLLDRLYSEQESLRRKLSRSQSSMGDNMAYLGALSDMEKSEVQAKHKEVLALISSYVQVPRDFLPLGIKSRAFLALGPSPAEEPEKAGLQVVNGAVRVIGVASFQAEDPQEISVYEGSRYWCVDSTEEGWVQLENDNQEVGLAPRWAIEEEGSQPATEISQDIDGYVIEDDSIYEVAEETLDPIEDDDEEGESTRRLPSGSMVHALQSFVAEEVGEVSVDEGTKVWIQGEPSDGWVQVSLENHQTGIVPVWAVMTSEGAESLTAKPVDWSSPVRVVCVREFEAEEEGELTVLAGQEFWRLPEESDEGWIVLRNDEGVVGLAPEWSVEVVSEGGGAQHDPAAVGRVASSVYNDKGGLPSPSAIVGTQASSPSSFDAMVDEDDDDLDPFASPEKQRQDFRSQDAGVQPLQVGGVDGLVEVVCVNGFEAEEDGELTVSVNERYWSRGVADDGWVQLVTRDNVEGLVPEWAVEPVNPTEVLGEVVDDVAPTSHANDVGGDRVQVQMLYDFVAESEEELTCNAGDTLYVEEEVDGWLLCTVAGGSRSGLVPASYVSGYE